MCTQTKHDACAWQSFYLHDKCVTVVAHYQIAMLDLNCQQTVVHQCDIIKLHTGTHNSSCGTINLQYITYSEKLEEISIYHIFRENS